MNPFSADISSQLVGRVAAIPAPPSDRLGPFRLYGLMIALGVLAGVYVAQRRWARWGGDPDAIVTVAIWAVPAGLVGARMYHVLTDWNRLYDDGRWLDALAIWNGGLGIPGGVLVGGIVGVVVARRTVPSWRRLADAAAPAIPIAQAIGRLGNYFNQELFGRQTDLPWGLRVDPAHRPVDAALRSVELFHPTFLYEALWNVSLAALILWGSGRWVLKPGRWFALYIAGYGLGRLWVEALRIDDAALLAGVRVNIWMSLVVLAGGLVWFLWGGGPLDRDATRQLRAGAAPCDILAAQTVTATLEPDGPSSSERTPEVGAGPEPESGAAVTRASGSESGGVAPPTTADPDQQR